MLRSFKENVSTSIGVKPRNIDEVKQSIAIRIGPIRTVADGTQQRRKQKPFHGSQPFFNGRMSFATQSSVGEPTRNRIATVGMWSHPSRSPATHDGKKCEGGESEG